MNSATADEASSEVRLAVVDLVPDLRAYARSLTHNPDRADDLVQDVIVRALSAAHQYTPGTNIKAWVFTILRNLYYNDGRENRRARFCEIDEVSNPPSMPPPQDGVLSFGDFQRAFWQLGPQQREVLILVGASGLSYQEAAAVSGCAVGTIKSRASRARQELQEILSTDAIVLSRRQSKTVAEVNLLELLGSHSDDRRASLE